MRVARHKRRKQALEAEQAELEGRVVALPSLVSRSQVEAFVGRLSGMLSDDPKKLRKLVRLLHREHDLQVELLVDRRVRVSLALDPGVLSAGTRVVATAAPRVEVQGDAGTPSMTAPEWAKWMNSTGRAPECACGCGDPIVVKARHRSKGLPRFNQGHHKMAMTAFVEQLNAEGYLTSSQAAEYLGVGTTTLRRMEERGEIAPEWRSWGGAGADAGVPSAGHQLGRER